MVASDAERRLRDLEARVAALERAAQAPSDPNEFPHPTRGSVPSPPPAWAWAPPPQSAPQWAGHSTSHPQASAPGHATGPASAWRPLPSEIPPQPQRPPFDIQKVLGARGLAWAGVLVLALGVVFFLKLAYDRGWVPIPGRFAIGVLGGLALFATGDLLRRRNTDAAYTQILSGGGAVIAYATVYMAWVLPDYQAALGLTLPVEVALLAAVSALLGGYAVWRDLPVLAAVAVFLSAALVAPAGAFSEVGLLYVGFLDFALLAAAAWRRWPAVVLAAATACNGAAILAIQNGVDWRLAVAVAVPVGLAGQVAAHRSRKADWSEVPTSLLASGLGAALLFVVLAVAFNAGDIAHPMGWAALAIAVPALAGAVLSRPLAPVLGGVGAALLLAWPAWQFPWALWQPFAYALLGAAALGLASAPTLLPRGLAGPANAPQRWLRTFAAAAAGLGTAALFLIAIVEDVVDTQPWAAGGLALLLLAVGGAQWILGRGRGEPQAAVAGLAAATLLLLLWPFVQFEASLLQTGTLAASSALLLAAALAWKREARTAQALGVAAATVGALSLLLLAGAEDVARLQPWAAGTLALALTGLGLLAWAFAAGPRGDPNTAWAGLGLAGLLVLLWPFVQFPDSLWQTFTLATAGCALLVGGLAWAPGRRPLHALGAATGATAIASLGVLSRLFDASSSEPAGAGGVTALILVLGGGLWLAARKAGEPTLRPAGLAVAAAAPLVYLGFLLEGWQIAVAWAVEGLALAAAGLPLRDTQVRIASFAIFGLVLGRIFLVDLQNLDLPFRVITFVCTGAVLLLAAYLFARQKKGQPAAAPSR